MKKILSVTTIGLLMSLFIGLPVNAETNIFTPDGLKIEHAVNLYGVKLHQQALMEISKNNDNNRSAGTQGYESSSDYVAYWLKSAGYEVEKQEFEFPYFQELSDPVFQTTNPANEPYEPNTQDSYYTMTYSGSGDAEAQLVPVDVVMPPASEPNTSNSGCEAQDFTDFPQGAIALIQRGSCSFYDKAINAQNAGASAAIIYNEGQTNRTNAIRGTLGGPEITIPVVFSTHEIGADLYELSQTQQVRAQISTDTEFEMRNSHNILASTQAGDPNNTVVIGAHLDSVLAGPGINDNGSGSAAVLEVATKIGWLKIQPENQITFAFWGAEELGLIGSEYYVGQLSKEQLATIELYLNFDMIASPNYVRFVYDGDGSDTDIAGPYGSKYIESFFVNHFAEKDLATDPSVMGGNSDYAPFMLADIPVGGLFTGAGGIKTEEQALVYGGTAGEPYDANYHTLEDNLDNLNYEVEEQMIKAMGSALDHFAYTLIPEPETAPLVRAAKSAATAQLDYQGPFAVR
ncbi:MAG: M20/M25/M40 family metallo-hydrolase [Desulfobacteraceae bacterium]|nr:M20/M25/M40 family metallo-hydrolase [Desulfobacteraceae bacterium]